MKRRFTQWGLFSGITALVSLIGLMINPRVMISTFEAMLGPWIYLCRAVTPDSWETMGNILLALAWMGSGILVYSALFGAIATFLLSLVEGRRDATAPKQKASLSGLWRPLCLGALGVGVVTTIVIILISTGPVAPKANPAKGVPKWEDRGEDGGKGETGSVPATPEDAVSDNRNG